MTAKKNIMTSRSFHLGRVGTGCLLILWMTGCASQAPLDDAYYWPDKAVSASNSATSATSTSPTTSASSASSTDLEFVNVQDTTITVKIKR